MFSSIDILKIRRNVVDFIYSCSAEEKGEFKYSIDGPITLYSSCYALMTLHYLCELPDKDYLNDWGDYFLLWQDQNTGFFLGPELKVPLSENAKHDFDHLAMHLTTTVLPCLDILKVKPKYPLFFAHKFLDEHTLTRWLHDRDWTDAWLEGNNLLFVLQLLIYLRDREGFSSASDRVEQFFEWLDTQVDPTTGLWGTNSYCSNFVAMCGGYHQLLAYYYEGREITAPEHLVDVVLALQHADGGFHPGGGGGACEDIDAIDILVNLYKRYDYRRPKIRVALRKAVKSILRKQVEDGGFVYKLNNPFIHMGMEMTLTPPNRSNMFSTWFRVHALALTSEILCDTALSDVPWRFNPSLSMGWHVSKKVVSDSLVRSACEEILSVGFLPWLKSRVSI